MYGSQFKRILHAVFCTCLLNLRVINIETLKYKRNILVGILMEKNCFIVKT